MGWTHTQTGLIIDVSKSQDPWAAEGKSINTSITGTMSMISMSGWLRMTNDKSPENDVIS